MKHLFTQIYFSQFRPDFSMGKK